MKWKFWQKKKTVGRWLLERKSEQAQESVIRRFEIPSGEVQWIRQLFDAYQSIPGGADKEAHYILWSAIADIFPEVRSGQWRLVFLGALGVAVEEYIPSRESR